MKDIIVNIISKQLMVENKVINGGTKILDDLGADSLDVVEMLMEIEDTLGVSIPDADVLDLKTINDVVNYVSRYVS